MDLMELARGYYRAFENYDRAFIENNLAQGFTFTSPFDDHIGREAYFRRCWPTTPLHRKFDFAIDACGPSIRVGTGTAASWPVTMTMLARAASRCAPAAEGCAIEAMATRHAPNQVVRVTGAPG